MSKKFISLLLSVTILIGCFSIGLSPVVTQARDIGVGTGAESFNPVKFSVGKEVLVGTDVNALLNIEVTDKNYKVRINSINASMSFYDESGSSGELNVSYTAGTVISGAGTFSVAGTIADDINSVIRYTIEYDILDKKDTTVWKNLTGYTYGFVSGKESVTGAVGTNYPYPGQLSDGCYFEVLDTLNTTYVQQSDLALLYKIRTQSAWSYHDPRTRGVNVISGNAPSTLITMPDNQGAARQGQMDWPKTGAVYRSASADWLRMTEPVSGYYNFTISFNSWGDDWEDQSNITETTEMYYIRNADRVAAYNAANKIMKTASAFTDGFYVQKGLYTTESWNNFINAIDVAYQVGLSVPNANYGYKIACQNAVSAVAAVDSAFASLQRAEHDFETYKDVQIVEATCTDNGSEIYTCICGEVKVVEIPALGHVHGEWQLSKPATCTAEGLDELVCTRCNGIVESKIISKLPHEYNTDVILPTCTERGYTTYSCVHCGDAYTSDYIEATGHDWVHVTTEPTCTEIGYTTNTCSICNINDIDSYVDAKGHTPGETVIENNIDVTCTTDGSYDSVVYCTICKEELSRKKATIEHSGHQYSDVIIENENTVTCTEDGSFDMVIYCLVCSEELLRETTVISASGHTEGEWVVTKPAEIGVAGEKVLYCAVCGETYETREIPAITAYLKEAKDTTTVIDKERGFIYGLKEGIKDIESFVEYKGGTLEYIKTENGFGTSTVVNFIVNGEVYESYTIVIFGDLDGDGVIDTYDATRLAEIVNGDLEVPEYSAVAFAADIENNDKVADTYDLTKLYEVVNGDTTIPQVI